MQQLQPNTLLQGGRYRIERVIGQGGFGITYLATHEPFGKKVAVKEFFMSSVNGRKRDKLSVSVSLATNKRMFESQRAKFKKEALRIHELRNEHIVEVTDFFEENGTSYYVMDFVEGETLAAVLQRECVPLSEQQILSLLPQMLNALAAIHNKGFYHLDIKPANIMVDGHGVLKLLDFGASKQQDADGGVTVTSAICYSNGFAPIEQMSNPPCYEHFGPWTDFYALGATLFQLLTGQVPPSHSDIMEDNSRDKHEAFPMPGITSGMKNLVLWMTQVARGKRPQNVKEIEDFCRSAFGKNTNKATRKSAPKTKPQKEDGAVTKVLGTSNQKRATPQSSTPAFDVWTYQFAVSYPYGCTVQYAQQGNAGAMFDYAVMCLRGEWGEKQDLARAYYWFERTKNKKDVRAKWVVEHWEDIKRTAETYQPVHVSQPHTLPRKKDDQDAANALIGKWHMFRNFDSGIFDCETEYNRDGNICHSNGTFVFAVGADEGDPTVFCEYFTIEGTWKMKDGKLIEKTTTVNSSGLHIYPNIAISRESLSYDERKTLEALENIVRDALLQAEESTITSWTERLVFDLTDEDGEFSLIRVNGDFNRFQVMIDGEASCLTFGLDDLWKSGLLTECASEVKVSTLGGKWLDLAEFPFPWFSATISKGIGHVELDDKGNLQVVCVSQSSTPYKFHIGKLGRINKDSKPVQRKKSFWQRLLD